MALDWSCCVICQQVTSEALKCPLNSPGDKCDCEQIYQSFLSKVAEFELLEQLPVQLNFKAETSTVDSFVANRASWHKSCYLKFGISKLEKARKRKINVDAERENNERPSKKSKRQSVNLNVCIFCEKGVGELHNISTLDMDSNIRKMAKDLEDYELLSRISGGDLIAIEAKYHLRCLTNLRNKHRTLVRKKQQGIK